MEEVDKELNLVHMYVLDCIDRMCLNVNIDKTKCSHHSLYTFDKYKDAVWDPWTGETVADRTRRVFKIELLFK